MMSLYIRNIQKYQITLDIYHCPDPCCSFHCFMNMRQLFDAGKLNYFTNVLSVLFVLMLVLCCMRVVGDLWRNTINTNAVPVKSEVTKLAMPVSPSNVNSSYNIGHPPTTNTFIPDNASTIGCCYSYSLKAVNSFYSISVIVLLLVVQLSSSNCIITSLNIIILNKVLASYSCDVLFFLLLN